jgi:phosphoserine phosphatase
MTTKGPASRDEMRAKYTMYAAALDLTASLEAAQATLDGVSSHIVDEVRDAFTNAIGDVKDATDTVLHAELLLEELKHWTFNAA